MTPFGPPMAGPGMSNNPFMVSMRFFFVFQLLKITLEKYALFKGALPALKVNDTVFLEGNYSF